MDQTKITEFEQKIGYTFTNQDYLREALTHRSFLNENPDFELPHNERLEFLGDAVLELAVTEYLYQEYPDTAEGVLTSYRAALVRGAHLAEVAKRFELEEFLQMSRGEENDKASKAYITANAVESLIAAIYLDASLEQAVQFVFRFIIPDLQDIIENKSFIDAKSFLQEKIQERNSVTPSYRVINDWGPDHDKTFEVAVFAGNEELAKGVGPSKQKAEQEAAKKAIDLLNLL